MARPTAHESLLLSPQIRAPKFIFFNSIALKIVNLIIGLKYVHGLIIYTKKAFRISERPLYS